MGSLALPGCCMPVGHLLPPIPWVGPGSRASRTMCGVDAALLQIVDDLQDVHKYVAPCFPQS